MKNSGVVLFLCALTSNGDQLVSVVAQDSRDCDKAQFWQTHSSIGRSFDTGVYETVEKPLVKVCVTEQIDVEWYGGERLRPKQNCPP